MLQVQQGLPGGAAFLGFVATGEGRATLFTVEQHHPAGPQPLRTQGLWHTTANHHRHIDFALQGSFYADSFFQRREQLKISHIVSLLTNTAENFHAQQSRCGGDDWQWCVAAIAQVVEADAVLLDIRFELRGDPARTFAGQVVDALVIVVKVASSN